MSLSSNIWGSQSSLSSGSSIADPLDGQIELKVKADRKVLETMINGNKDPNQDSAEEFFTRVANESGAVVVYPRRGKLHLIGRRDPEIRLFGSQEQVHMAKGLILDLIGPYKSRVTLKVDISHSDHSHIIGKGGKRIQTIMTSTETHIHFPDCNRIESEAKSNQVTIAGNSLRKVEEARQLIRQHLPLTVAFNVEVNANNIEFISPSHPNIQFYQKRYNVIITFKIPEANAVDNRLVTVKVRGTRLQFDDLREAVRSLHSHLTWSSLGWHSLVVTIEIDISSQHHAFVMGRGSCNVKAINEHTGAVVSFPDFSVGSAGQPVNSGLVLIRGRGIDSAYLAWLELLGYLPVTMIFALAPEHQLDSKLLQQLMNDYELSVVIRQKYETGGKLLVLKTQEKNSNILFEARKRIVGVKEELPSVVPTPPTTVKSMTDDWFSTSAFNFHNYEPEVLRAFRPLENVEMLPKF